MNLTFQVHIIELCPHHSYLPTHIIRESCKSNLHKLIIILHEIHSRIPIRSSFSASNSLQLQEKISTIFLLLNSKIFHLYCTSAARWTFKTSNVAQEEKDSTYILEARLEGTGTLETEADWSVINLLLWYITHRAAA